MGYHSGTPDSASLAAQQADGQTDLVTPAARAAAEALAAGATPTRIGAICAAPIPAQVACPAFTAGDASLAMGTLKATECVVESTRTLSQASALTIPVTDMVAGQLYAVSCYALALGYALTVVSATVTLATFDAALTKPKMHVFFFDGVALVYDHTEFLEA
jgi:hypothetical protein